MTLLLSLGCITDKLSASGRRADERVRHDNDHWSCVTGESVALPVRQREWCVNMVSGEMLSVRKLLEIVPQFVLV